MCVVMVVAATQCFVFHAEITLVLGEANTKIFITEFCDGFHFFSSISRCFELCTRALPDSKCIKATVSTTAPTGEKRCKNKNRSFDFVQAVNKNGKLVFDKGLKGKKPMTRLVYCYRIIQ